MMNNLPLRLTTLHFAQRLRIDGETFIVMLSLHDSCQYSQSLNYTRNLAFRPEPANISWDSQDEGISFGNSH